MDETEINAEQPEDNETGEAPKGKPRSSVGANLALVALVVLIGMCLLEWVLQLTYPAGTFSQHVAAIIGACILATAAAYIVLRKQSMSLREASTEAASHRQANAELEQKAAELTDELIGANKQMREEMEERRKAEQALDQAQNDFQHRLDEGIAELSSENQQLTQQLNELKKAYTKLRRSEKKFRNLLDSIEDGYYEVDISGNLTFFNNALCTIAGLPRGKLKGMNNREYTSPESAKKMYRVFNKVYKTGEPAKEFDWEIIHPDGSKRYVEASVSLIRNSKGEGVGFRGIVRDITERKRAEDKLKSLLYSFGKVWTK
jgi:PAS domain S-box-containing protein